MHYGVALDFHALVYGIKSSWFYGWTKSVFNQDMNESRRTIVTICGVICAGERSGPSDGIVSEKSHLRRITSSGITVRGSCKRLKIVGFRAEASTHIALDKDTRLGQTLALGR